MKHPKKLLSILTIGVFMLLATPVAWGQQASAADNVQETTLMDRWNQGGWAMYPLALLSIAAFGLIVYNFIMVRKKVLTPDTSIQDLQDMAASLDVDGINDHCENNPNPVTNIFAAGMERVSAEDFDPEAIQSAMDDASAEELATPFSMINFLNIVANVAPMVGMLGTVSGMVKAFGNIAKAGGMADPATMANNISEALITTMSGLAIAIPAMIFYFFFKNKYGKLVAGMQRSLGDIYHSLVVTVRNPNAGAYQAEGYAEEGYYEEEGTQE